MRWCVGCGGSDGGGGGSGAVFMRWVFFGGVPVVARGQRYQKNALNPLVAI